MSVYQNKFGQALRGPGRSEFGTTFDAVPLSLVIEVPAKVANEIAMDGLLAQQLLEIAPVMQRHVVTLSSHC